MKIPKTSKRTAKRTEAQCFCRTCSKEFWRPVANVRAGMGQYCSRDCAAKASARRVLRSGETQGGGIERPLVTRVVEHTYEITRSGARRHS